MCNFGEAILEQGYERGIEQGIEQGMERGEQRVNRLIQLLLAQSRFGEIEKAVNDKKYQQKLFKEFQL